jgi:hypothetical protein
VKETAAQYIERPHFLQLVGGGGGCGTLSYFFTLWPQKGHKTCFLRTVPETKIKQDKILND